MAAPTGNPLQTLAAKRSARPDGRGHSRDGQRPADWCQRRSCAVALVNFVTDFFPRGILEFIHQTAALNHERFPFPFCGFGLFFFPNPTLALSEINRVLKSDGMFCLSVWTKPDDRRRWLIDLVKDHLQSETDFNEAIRLLPKGFDDEEKIATALQDGGFVLEKTHLETLYVSYKSDEEWWETQYSHGIRSIFEVIENKLGQVGLMRFKKDVFKKLSSMQVDGNFNQQLKAIFVKAKKLK